MPKGTNSIGAESRVTESNPVSTIGAANLLKGVEKSYEDGKLLLDDIELYERAAVNEISGPGTTGGVTKTTAYTDAKLRNFFIKAREARNNSSKVIDDNGETKPVSHSANSEFTVFKNKQEK